MRRILVVVLSTLLLVSLADVGRRQLILAYDTQGLIISAVIEKSSEDYVWYKDPLIPKDTAMWLIRNTEYHYSNCSSLTQRFDSCDQSNLLSAVNLSESVVSTNQGIDFDHIWELIVYFIERGDDLNVVQPPSDLTLVQTAILKGNACLTDYLLKAGADINLTSGAQTDKILSKWFDRYPDKYAPVREVINYHLGITSG